MTRITAPVEGYTGTTQLGPLALVFADGVAEHDGDLPAGARAYLEAAGYGLDGSSPSAPAPVSAEPADPRDVERTQVGTRTRDGAVDPQPVDFLPPVNAGQDNPHGSSVVAPGIHAIESLPIAPGPVFEDLDAQQAKESGLAEDVLVRQRNVGAATLDAAGETSGLPKGNASREAWATYALEHGATAEDIDGLTRDALRELYGV
ncbi:hypothetical protein GCM10027586_00830 [Kineococcus gypseus]|uniref:hypothetical protein n=1 Tax=Kineococcus gypseus TaxID=1637102 RepID=UPI003D7C3C1F